MRPVLLAAALLLAAGCSRSAPPADAAGAQASRYAADAAWLCRPGREDACSTADLDAVAAAADGARTPEPFTRTAAAPPVDCFYVYPTISADPALLSDMTPGPEEARITVNQAARFASRCRLFAPVYRQITLAGLNAAFATRREPDWNAPYGDVRDAWRDYLRRDNGGRGVVLIGHSQGALLLARLLAEEIEPDPAQHRLLVSAILAGHTGLAVPDGFNVGGDLKRTPLCRAAAQAGCAVVFATYAADDGSPRRFFGRVAAPDSTAACVNPAAPAGGSGALEAYLPRAPLAPAADPPFTRVAGQLSAECVTDEGGSVLRVTVQPGADEAALRGALTAAAAVPGWGTHLLDMNLTQGNLLRLVDAQTRAWFTDRGKVPAGGGAGG